MGNPNFLGGGRAQNDGSGGGAEGKSLIVVTFEQIEVRAGANATCFQKFQKLAITLINSAHAVTLARLRLRKQLLSAAAAALGAFHFA
jgi:hypothetical protein